MNQNRNLGKLSLFRWLVFLAICLPSCVKEKIDKDQISDKITISPTLAFPLAQANFTLKDAIPNDSTGDSFLYVDENNLVHLKYSADLDRFSVMDVLGTIPKQDTSVNFIAEQDFNVEEFNQKLELHEVKKFNYHFEPNQADQQIDTLYIKSMTLRIYTAAGFPYSGSFTVTYPTLFRPNGQIYSFTIYNHNEATKDTLINFSDAKLILNHGDLKNQMPVEYDLIMRWSGTNVSTTDLIKATVEASQIEPLKVFGYLGDVKKAIAPSAIELPYLKKIEGGSIWLAEPKLDITIKNSLGIPMSFTHSGIKADLLNGGSTIITGLDPILYIDAPAVSELGSTKSTIFSLNQTSNISEVITQFPTSISFNGVVSTNPNGFINNFVTDSSYFQPSIDLDIPFNLEAVIAEFRDTVAINITDIADADAEKINYAKLYILLKNGFPVEAKSQIYLLDENEDILDSLFSPDMIKINSADVGTNGIVDNGEEKETTVEVEFTTDKLKKLIKAKYLILKMAVQTPSATPTGTTHNPVKLFTNYKLGMKVSVVVSTTLSN